MPYWPNDLRVDVRRWGVGVGPRPLRPAVQRACAVMTRNRLRLRILEVHQQLRQHAFTMIERLPRGRGRGGHHDLPDDLGR
ncbi:Uncharacterised protein [Mycobacteroides abscessus subsp. abscessus]|nr:Uncharacterised protein [Mycobacteroides abscessus subsp. abscessus]